MAGVSVAVGSEGLQMFMGEKSEAVTSSVGVLSSRTLGGLRVLPAAEAGPPQMDDMLLSASPPDTEPPLSACEGRRGVFRVSTLTNHSRLGCEGGALKATGHKSDRL